MDPAYISDLGVQVACSSCGVWHLVPCPEDPPLPGDHVEVSLRCHTRAVVHNDRYQDRWAQREWERADWLSFSTAYAMYSTTCDRDMY